MIEIEYSYDGKIVWQHPFKKESAAKNCRQIQDLLCRLAMQFSLTPNDNLLRLHLQMNARNGVIAIFNKLYHSILHISPSSSNSLIEQDLHRDI